jgi:hypothetical protein
MDLFKAGVHLCGCLALCQVISAQAPYVTDTKLVNAEKGKQELLRKINGRWWSQDNREVTPPPEGGFFWVLDSKPGVCQFYHHRPFQLSRAESLHLWMKQDEVEAVLGPPNRTFGRDAHAFWSYYAANGTKLVVRFMDEGVLGEATYEPVHGKSWPVASIESELAGRSIYKLLAERAGKRSEEEQAKKMEEFRNEHQIRASGSRSPVRPSMVTVEPATPGPQTPAKKTIVSVDALAAVSAGATRENVLSRLGEPSSRYSIDSGDGVRESFTYDLASGETVVIRLSGGKVVARQ